MALLVALVPVIAVAQSLPMPSGSPVDSVALYVLPTDGISEQGTSAIARALTRDTGLWVKSTVWVAPGNIEPLAGTNQYPAEDYLALGVPFSRQLLDANARTYFIVLTDKDINSRTQNFRFQFSMHSPMARTSVLSIARLGYMTDGTLAPSDVVASRVQKMLMRIVGEMRQGWKRSAEPTDLMFAPVMSVEDIDRMDLTQSVQRRRQTR
ncbi:MAG: hypothetical protein ACKVOX_12615 [Rhizobacter sp.]